MLVGIAFIVLRFGERRESAQVPPAVSAATVSHAPDSVVLADIANNTGDPVFNTTLRQAMAIELEQSPCLRLVPDSRIQQSLRLSRLSGLSLHVEGR
jgi:hypothetical protein